MKKLIDIFQVALYALLTILLAAQTIASIMQAQTFYAWQVGFVLMTILAAALTYLAGKELNNNKQ